MVPPDEVAAGAGRPPPLHLRRHLAGMGAGAGAVLLFLFLRSRPELAERILSDGLLSAFVRLLARVTSVVPFALAELVVLGIGVLLALAAARGIAQVRRGRDRVGRTLLRGGLRLGRDAGILVALFVLLWGVQHTRPDLEARLDLQSSSEPEVEELALLASAAVRATNDLYLELHGVRDAGAPTPAAPRGEIRAELDRAWERAAARYGLPVQATLPHGAPKSVLSTPVLRRFGVAGMYFPYTAEILLLRDLPGVLMPKEMAHEMAHQRGFASESDANALAFLVCREARDPRIRYAGYVFLQRQLLAALAVADRDRALEVASERVPGVVRDLDDRARYWEPARGWTRELGAGLNDAMLRAHGVEEGIASYQRSAWIFVALAREGGVEALMPPELRPSSPW